MFLSDLYGIVNNPDSWGFGSLVEHPLACTNLTSILVLGGGGWDMLADGERAEVHLTEGILCPFPQ